MKKAVISSALAGALVVASVGVAMAAGGLDDSDTPEVEPSSQVTPDEVEAAEVEASPEADPTANDFGQARASLAQSSPGAVASYVRSLKEAGDNPGNRDKNHAEESESSTE